MTRDDQPTLTVLEKAIEALKERYNGERLGGGGCEIDDSTIRGYVIVAYVDDYRGDAKLSIYTQNQLIDWYETAQGFIRFHHWDEADIVSAMYEVESEIFPHEP